MNSSTQLNYSPAEVRGLAEARSILQEIMLIDSGESEAVPAELQYGGERNTVTYNIILAGGGPAVNLSGRLSGNRVISARLTYSNWHVQDVRVELTPRQSASLLNFAQAILDGGHLS